MLVPHLVDDLVVHILQGHHDLGQVVEVLGRVEAVLLLVEEVLVEEERVDLDNIFILFIYVLMKNSLWIQKVSKQL